MGARDPDLPRLARACAQLSLASMPKRREVSRMLYALLALIALVFATPANAQVARGHRYPPSGASAPGGRPRVSRRSSTLQRRRPTSSSTVASTGSSPNGGWHVESSTRGSVDPGRAAIRPAPCSCSCRSGTTTYRPDTGSSGNVKGRPTGSTSGDRAAREARMEGPAARSRLGARTGSRLNGPGRWDGARVRDAGHGREGIGRAGAGRGVRRAGPSRPSADSERLDLPPSSSYSWFQ